MGRSSYQEKLGNLKDHSGADAVRTAGQTPTEWRRFERDASLSLSLPTPFSFIYPRRFGVIHFAP